MNKALKACMDDRIPVGMLDKGCFKVTGQMAEIATPKSGSCQGGGPYAAWRARTLAAHGRRKAAALRLT